MKEPAFEDERLRQAFASLSIDAETRSDCPDPERLWAAAEGDLPEAEIHTLVDHLSDCPSCAEDWRLAQALRTEAALSSETTTAEETVSSGPTAPDETLVPFSPRPKTTDRRGPWTWGLLAAATLTLVLALQWIGPSLQPPDVDPVYRAGEGSEIRSLLPEAQLLARQQPLLRWTPGEEGTRYHLLVSNSRFEVLYEANDLASAETLIPAHALADLQPGEEIFWRVEAEFPDGETLDSPTFVARLE